MRNIAICLMVGLIVEPLLAADRSYAFHVSIKSVYEALGILDPAIQNARSGTPADRARLEAERIVLFSRGEGTDWKAVIGGCPHVAEGKCEVAINSYSGGSYKPDGEQPRGGFDMAFRVKADGDLVATCLRASCGLHIEKAGRASDRTMALHESADVPIDSDVRLTLRK